MPLTIIWGKMEHMHADALVAAESAGQTESSRKDSWPYMGVGGELRLGAREALGKISYASPEAIPATGMDQAKFLIVTALPDGPAMLRPVLVRRSSVCTRRSLELARSLGCRSIALPLLCGSSGQTVDILKGMLRVIGRFLEESDADTQVTLVLGRGQIRRERTESIADISDYIRNKLELPEAEEAQEEPASDASEGSSFGAGRADASEGPSVGTGRADALQGGAPAGAPPKAAGAPPKAARVVPGAEELPQRPGREFFDRDEDEAAGTSRRRTGWFERTKKEKAAGSPPPYAGALDDAAAVPDLSHLEDSFQEQLMTLIRRKKMDEADVYKRANLDRRHFSKIRCNPAYQPTKRTALALAVGLRLSLEETEDLLRRAGLALSHSSKGDIIVEFFILRGEYDIHTINLVLFEYNQQLLGS